MATSTMNMNVNNDCGICCEKYTKKMRLRVICENEKCNYEACISCIKMYIENTTDMITPNCMNCKMEYTQIFIEETFPKTFIKKLNKKKEKKEINMIKEKLPQYMEIAENEKNIRKLTKEIKEERVLLNDYKEHYEYFNKEKNNVTVYINKEIEYYKEAHNNQIQNNNLKEEERMNYIICPESGLDEEEVKELYEKLIKMTITEIINFCRENELPVIPHKNGKNIANKVSHVLAYLNKPNYCYVFKKFEEYKNLVKYQKKIIKEKNDKLKLLRETNYNMYIDIENGTSKKKNNTPCPNNDCRGYLSDIDENNSRKCNLCNVELCESCNKIKEEEHKCNKDDIKTVKMIKKNTKPCPNPSCNVRIHKTEGCDQMWCVNCHTTFSWNTGKIKDGEVIHNPEYIQYVKNIEKKNKENVKNNVFGECNTDVLPTIELINNTIRQRYIRNDIRLPIDIIRIQKYMRYLNGLKLYYINCEKQDKKKDNNNKVKYILGEIDEKKLYNNTNKITKELNYYKEVKNTIELQIDIGKETLWAIVNNTSKVTDVYNEIVDHFYNFCEHMDIEDTKMFLRYGKTIQRLRINQIV